MGAAATEPRAPADSRLLCQGAVQEQRERRKRSRGEGGAAGNGAEDETTRRRRRQMHALAASGLGWALVAKLTRWAACGPAASTGRCTHLSLRPA